MNEFFGWASLSSVALALLLISEWRNSTLGRSTFKFIASMGFLGAAVVMGAFDVLYGQVLLVGLALSWLGDIFLISRGPRLFKWGLVSFFLAHAAFGCAFLTLGHNWNASIVTFGALSVAGAVILWLLLPSVPAEMRGPVFAYVVVITLMVSLAAGSYWNGADYIILMGAVTFYLSDLFVARDRFIADSYVNTLFGLPLYYAAQFMFAFSVATL
jgi:uncharacterized membrane protein YhhN